MSLVVLVTGASSGFGQLLLQRLRARGHRVFGTSRHGSSGADGAPLLTLDVRDDASVAHCVALVEQAGGPIDVLVNNAGVVLEGPFEEMTIEQLRDLFDTNFLGAVRMSNAVLPSMRSRRQGRIINVGSLAGLIPLPFLGPYCAAKHALDSYSESLYHELRPLGVSVAIVAPGYYNTGIATRKQRSTAHIADYDAQRSRMYATIAHDEQRRAGPPDEVVALLERIVEGRSRRLRHVLGPDAITYLLRGLVPEWLWTAVMRRVVRLDPWI